MKTIKDVFVSALWGTASFVFVFFLVPTLFIGMPDAIWISICIAVPVFVALVVFRKYMIKPVFVISGMLVQFALLVIFSDAVSRKWGMNLTGLGVFEYISLFVYPVAITVLSWILLKLFIKNKKAE